MDKQKTDLNLLIVFDAVYEHRSISRAAEALDLSQPAISNALARLRKQVGDPLFVRKGNGVRPTSRADSMVEPVRQALGLLNQSISPVQSFDPLTSETNFNLFIPNILTEFVVPPLGRETLENKKITYTLKPPQSTHIEEELIKGTLDLALHVQPTIDPDIKFEPLCPMNIVIMCKRGHPAMQETELQGLLKYPHVQFDLTANGVANANRVQVGQHPNPATILVTSILEIPLIVSNTDLIGLAPYMFAKSMMKYYDIEVRKIPNYSIDQEWQMIWHKRNDDNEAHKWLRKSVKHSMLSAYENLADL